MVNWLSHLFLQNSHLLLKVTFELKADALLHDIGKINCYEYNQRNIDIT